MSTIETQELIIRRAVHDLSRTIANRRGLVAFVATWLAVVYLVTPPGLHRGAGSVSPFSPAGIAEPSRPASDATTFASAPDTTAGGSDNASLGGSGGLPGSDQQIGIPSYDPVTPPTAAPSDGPTCPLPIPASPPPALPTSSVLAALSPLLAASGPFTPEVYPMLGVVTPLLPTVTPLLVLGKPALDELGPPLAAGTGLLNQVETSLAAPFGPQISQFNQTVTPGEEQLVKYLNSLETTVLALPGAGCVAVTLDDLAASAPSTPPLPTLPALPVSSSAGGYLAAVAVPLSWANGVSPSSSRAVADLVARGFAVKLDLGDIPPAGTQPGGTGFADWVAKVVRAFPAVSMFEIQPSVISATSSSGIDDVVHGLAAAAAFKAPGQLVGLSWNPAVGDNHTWWTELAARSDRQLPRIVNFVTMTAPSPDSAERNGHSLRTTLMRFAGLDTNVPIFIAVPGLMTGRPDLARLRAATLPYRAASTGLGVGMVLAGDSGVAAH